MCGIIGFNWNDKTLLKKCLRKINHRGPDQSSSYNDKNISLGHNRLSIVDLSNAGIQPMSNEDESLMIVFNGEVYNHKQIKSRLKKKHDFKSNTDTEVILHLYEEVGIDFVNHLQGMFSIAIYDKKRKLILLARDRIGIKPLYYFSSGENFIFSSEIKSLLEYSKIKKEVNLFALQSYLKFRANTSHETFFKGVMKLPPGNILIYDLKKNNFEIKNYWKISFDSRYFDENKIKTNLRELLEDSVKSRLMSDVPYGAFLSGGVDSGTIVALMKKYSSKKVKTFSVGFKEQKHSEINEARFLAKVLNTDHHELIIDEKSISVLPEIIFHSDEPIADPTLIPTYLLSKYAKKYCTVILTGEGSDEIFGGYVHYKLLNLHKKVIRRFPKSLRKMSLIIFNLIPNLILDKFFSFNSSLGKKGRERLESFLLSDKPNEQYLSQISLFTQKELSNLLIKNYSKNKFDFNIDKKDVINSAGEFDFNHQMVEDLLMKVDKTTMAFAIEGRVPFLDHRIVELASKIDSELKVKNLFNGKYILRESIEDLIPKETNKRKKKYFFVPIEEWIKKDLMPLRNKLLSKEYLKKQGIFNYNYIQNINQNFEESPLYYSRQLWAILVFQIWFKIYIENEKVEI